MAHRLVLLLALFFASALSHAAIPAPVAQALAAGAIPESAVGLYVHEVSSERAVIAHGAERPLNPASTWRTGVRSIQVNLLCLICYASFSFLLDCWICLLLQR